MTVGSDRPSRLREREAASIASALTDRDRKIADDCYEHRVLTTEQLRRLHFTGTRSTRQRLRRLYELRVLDSFRPAWTHGEGSTPYHWVLDVAGTYVVATGRGCDPADLHWSRQGALSIAGSSTLPHRRATNEFATLLIAELRAAGGVVPVWLGERGSHALLDGIVVPDSYLVLVQPDAPPRHVLVEFDRGTEDHDRLRTKARRYAKAIPRSPIADADPLVLLLTPSERRARTVASTLADGPWPIAVAAWDGQRSSLALVHEADERRGDDRRLRSRSGQLPQIE